MAHPAQPLPAWKSNTPLDPSFETDIRNTHLVYDYDAEDAEGKPEKWRYEIWFYSEDHVVYAIHGGPMAGRINFQRVQYQCVRPGQLWQVNWLEETGTIVSAVYDMERREMTTLIAFSQGHWERAEEAHGNKRNPDDFARWRRLAQVGKQTDRFMLCERATILQTFKGQGELEDLPENPETI